MEALPQRCRGGGCEQLQRHSCTGSTVTAAELRNRCGNREGGECFDADPFTAEADRCANRSPPEEGQGSCLVSSQGQNTWRIAFEHLSMQ